MRGARCRCRRRCARRRRSRATAPRRGGYTHSGDRRADTATGRRPPRRAECHRCNRWGSPPRRCRRPRRSRRRRRRRRRRSGPRRRSSGSPRPRGTAGTTRRGAADRGGRARRPAARRGYTRGRHLRSCRCTGRRTRRRPRGGRRRRRRSPQTSHRGSPPGGPRRHTGRRCPAPWRRRCPPGCCPTRRAPGRCRAAGRRCALRRRTRRGARTTRAGQRVVDASSRRPLGLEFGASLARRDGERNRSSRPRRASAERPERVAFVALHYDSHPRLDTGH